MKCMFLLVFLLSTELLGKVAGTKNEPCDAKDRLHDMELRFDNYKTDTSDGEHYICDKYYIPTEGHWYRVKDQQMPTKPPDMGVCGTLFPIWLNGSLPTKNDKTAVNRTGCLKHGLDNCFQEFRIQIKVCEGYYVYFLPQVQTCDAAYCFGKGTTDIPPTYKPETPVVNPVIITATSGYAETKFLCAFNTSLKESLYYQVYWYIDNILTYVSPAVKTNVTEGTKLLPHFVTKVGVNIKCAVRAKNIPDGVPGKRATSASIFTGIHVDKTHITLQRFSKSQFKIKPAMPFGCFFGANFCELYIQMTVPNDDNSCKGRVTSAHNCFVKIANHDWDKWTSINVTWQDSGYYNLQKSETTFSLRLKTSFDLHQLIWHNYLLPEVKSEILNINMDIDQKRDTFSCSGEVQSEWRDELKYKQFQTRVAVVHVTENTLSHDKTYCQAHNDPHMVNFDQRHYEHQMNGTYVLYDHVNDLNETMQVQISIRHCGHLSYYDVFCLCGVAVRAGGDLFVINYCDGHHLFDYVRCGDNILTVDKYKSNERKYNIMFPTGTEVEIDIASDKWMNIRVYPSVNDFKNTRGLCGNFSSDCTDDFQLSDGTLSKATGAKDGCYPPKKFSYFVKDFSVSWTPENAGVKNLFELKPHETLHSWTNIVKYCTCPNDTAAEDRISCEPTQVATCSRKSDMRTIGVHMCQVPKHRRKRSLEYPWKSYHNVLKKFRRSVPDNKRTKSKLTKDESDQQCHHYMKASPAFQACEKVPNVPTQGAIEFCSMDAQLTSTMDWSKQTLESLKGSCYGELRKNKSLLEEQDDGTPSVASIVKQSLCPGVPTCSGNGTCINGTCYCDDGYGSADCSFDLSIPPYVTGLRGEGLCDINELSCDTAMLIGPEIINTQNLSCRIVPFTINFSGVRVHGKPVDKVAEHETLTEVHCPLSMVHKRRYNNDDDEDDFVKGSTVSVSYDAVTYGEQFDFIAYDDSCQAVNHSTNPTSFSLKDGYCFIDRQCIQSGQNHPSLPCLNCNSSLSNTSWSKVDNVPGCISTTTVEVTTGKDEGTTKEVTIGKDDGSTIEKVTMTIGTDGGSTKEKVTATTGKDDGSTKEKETVTIGTDEGSTKEKVTMTIEKDGGSTKEKITVTIGTDEGSTKEKVMGTIGKDEGSTKEKTKRLWIIGPALGGLLVLVMGVVGGLVLKRYREKRFKITAS